MRASLRGWPGASSPTSVESIIFALLFFCSSPGLMAQGAVGLVSKLANASDYSAQATFEVYLPNAPDPVIYTVDLQSEAATADTLAPCSYYIAWKSPSPSGEKTGFTAYFGGDMYRYRNGQRVQEYHAQAQPGSFAPGGNTRMGVQSTAQFADLLPQFLALAVSEITTDPSYIYAWHPDTIIDGRSRAVIDGTKRGAGYDVKYFTYVFDRDTGMPVYSEAVTSPGAISEQTITVNYAQPSAAKVTLSEQGIMDANPGVFENYRESTFRTENLVGNPLPGFSAKRVGEDRYTYTEGQPLEATTVIVAVDPQVATAAETIAAVRESLDRSPRDFRVMWAFTGNNEKDILDTVGETRPEETVLMSARDLVRNLGITLYPTIVIAGRDGVVKVVRPGFNKDLSEFVLQSVLVSD